MSVKVMSMVWEYSQAKGGDLIILLAIADHADDEGKAFPGEDRLAKKGRMTDRNVRHCLQGLQAMGELTVAVGRGRGHPNHYQINIDVLLSRAKEGNVFQEKNTGNVFQEKISRKNATLNLIKAEKSDRKSGSPLPTNHQLTISTIQPSQNTPLPPKGERTRGTRLPEDWQPTAEDWAWAQSKGYDQLISLEEATEAFRYYWHTATHNPRKLNWSKTWKNRLIELSSRVKARASPRSTNQPSHQSKADQDAMFDRVWQELKDEEEEKKHQ